MDFKYIIVEEQARAGVSLIRLNRPKELNALNLELMGELVTAFKALDKDEATRCIVITGRTTSSATPR